MGQFTSRIPNRLIVVCMAVSLAAGVLFFSGRALMQGGVTLADDFNDNSLDTAKWDANNLFSGFSDTSLPVAETNQRFEIGPLLQNTSGSHYRGIRTVNSYNFSNSYSFVELARAADSTTAGDAMFTVGNSVDAYYRLFVSAGNLIGLRKIGATKTTLFTISYDSTNHRFLRIRHDSNTGNVILDTAPGSGGIPGPWVQRYTEAWNSSISLTGMIFEMKGGTSQAEANAAGNVIFDNFQFGSNGAPPANPPTVSAISPSSGSTSGGTSVTITGTGFATGAMVSLGGSAATNVSVVSSTSISATTPAHAAGAVNVVVTNPDTQSGTLTSGFTYSSGGGSSEAVLLADDFNDNSLNTANWDANNLFSGLTDTSLPVAETNQQFAVGPLLQNTSGSHYRGIRTVNSYGFTGAYSYVELVRAATSTTLGDAMLTVGNNVDNYYRLYVSGGTLYGLRKAAATKTTLFSLPYNTTNHRFLRIRHDAATGNVTLDTATGSAGVPGSWVQQYSEAWNPSISLTGMIFEVKGGTSQAETTAPDKVIFDNFKAAIPGSGGGGTPPSTGTERLDPSNRTGGGGENPLSRNFNWSIPLVQLPGRAALDLELLLAYNSLVWTKTGSSISFDDDHGFPGPGFHLGFPVIQSYFNTQLNQNGYLFLAPDGSRVELRRVGATTLYEAVDSSYLLLDSSTMNLRTGDGTQLSYALIGSDFQCTEIKDRNGNYITVNYTNSGRVDTVIDTLNRTIKFNYDTSNALTSITQTWTVSGSNVTHTWAAFEYRNPNLTISTNFPGLTTAGAQNGGTLKVLSQVILADNSRVEFDYTSWGQVWKISRIANDGVTLLNYRSYNLPRDNATAQTDCPRFTQRRDWARYWNRDVSGNEQEAITSFIVPTSTSWTMPAPDGSTQSGTMCQVTLPDGTSLKMYSHASGWDKGLPLLTETYDSTPTLQRQVMTTWTQDNTGLTVPLNPRMTETNTYDPAGNRKRTRITYQQISLPDTTSCSLPQDVFEYQANATTVLRSTRTTYNTNSAYTSRRIIGLVSDESVYEGDVTAGAPLASKFGYQYDETGSIQGSDAPVQHDNTNYSSGFVTGRANLSSVKRYDVNNTSQFTTTNSKYNTAGAVLSATDASGHTAQISYTDAFSDNVSRNTLAYPTTFTDPDNFSSTIKYNFDFGAVTYRRTPPAGTNLNGPEQTFTYDPLGRLERTTNLVDNAYSRYLYGPNYIESWSTVNTVADEAHNLEILDGAGRTIATAMNHPGSIGGFSGELIVYDAMGRAVKQSNPTETSVSIQQPAAPINPFAWAPAGDDSIGGWIYSQQTYDWKGRFLVTTNQDGTTRIASYSGCGCAGGEVVTLKDEGILSGGVLRRRQKKIYSDVLGRQVKTEIFNWEDGTAYAATVNTYNGRDQVTQSRTYAGTEGSATFQDTTLAYDGYGRLQSRHVPEQSASTATVWTYNADDTISTVTDARGATTSFGYTGTQRHLVKSITHTLSGSSTISASFNYDAAGNRLSMTDALGSVSYSYDQLSQITSETRTLAVGSFTVNYAYNLANQLTSITDPFGASFSYTRDLQGRLKSITGTPYAGTTNYINDVQYRAWGSPKSVAYSNTTSTIGYGFRLEPRQFRLTANSNGSSVMREDYSYFGDGKLASLTDLDDTPGSNPPATLRFLSRAYSYDHAGRIVDAHGTGSGSMQGVPFAQTYAYDQFDNTTSRSGSYYNYTFTQPATDTATYVNNRRTNWNYNAEGQVLGTPLTSTDSPRTMIYDAAGRMVSSVETNQFNTVTYSAAYDGDGELAFESSVTNPGTTQTSYIVRSTVLGDVLTRLDQSGNKKITHVPAEGLLFATQGTDSFGPSVLLTQRNPLGISETTKAVYDPLGNYIPFQASGDPRPPAGSFSSASMGGLSSSQANPFSYAVGCMLDGIPSTCNKVLHAINNGQGKTLQIDGRQNPNVVLANTGIFLVEYPMDNTKRTPPSWRPPQPNPKPGNGNPYNIGRDEHTWGLALVSFDNSPQTPSTGFDISGIRKGLQDALKRWECRELIQNLLDAVRSKKNPPAKAGVIMDLFEAVVSQRSFTRSAPTGSAGYGNPLGKIKNNDAGIFLKAKFKDPALQLLSDIQGTLHELLHLAGYNSYYTDEEFARAVYNNQEYHSRSPYPPDTPALRNELKEPGAIGWGAYWNDLLMQKCFQGP